MEAGSVPAERGFDHLREHSIGLPQVLFQRLEDAQVAPQSLAGHQPGNVREDVIRLILEQPVAVLAELAAAVHLLGDADPERYAKALEIAGDEAGVDGLLVPPENVPALAHAMDTLMTDDSERHRLAQAGREVLLRFGVAPVMAQWDRLLEDLIL